MTLLTAESWVGRIGALAGLATLAAAVWGSWRAQARPAGRETGAARTVLRRPMLVMAALAFVAAGVLLWRPLGLDLSPWARLAALLLGGLLYFSGLALYVWGMRTLQDMFGASSGFGVRLQRRHRLVVEGPYRYVRHPMYLAVIIVGVGGMLLYRTWAMLAFAVCMLGLVYRARREEEALAQEFGAEWEAYAARVPEWIPRVLRR